MQRLFQFFYQYRAFLFFVFLEVACFWLIIKNNNYQAAAYFNTSNYYAGRFLETTHDVKYYFTLKKVNKELADENSRLRARLIAEERKKSLVIPNKSDFLRINQYAFIPAKVINNSTSRFSNYITLNKGLADGVKPGMGVISPKGVVGMVKNCSEHFSVVTSLLHDKWSISSKIRQGNVDGITKWDGGNPGYANLLYVGRHHKLKLRDSVVTSGYGTIFPEGILVGRVKEFEVDKGEPFYKVRVLLATDFTALSYVYVIENKLKPERDSLKVISNTGLENEE